MTKPYWKIRYTLRTMAALSKIGLLPSNAKAVKLPQEKRMAMGPEGFMLGDVPDVPFRDEQVTTRDGASIRVRVYEPEGATVPLLYIHGGGFAFGGIKSCDHICKQIAHDAGVVVVSVEYRLAPEFSFPVPLQDCEDAFAWLRIQGWDDERLFVGGDSAGGNLAAAMAMLCRDGGIPLIGQLLIYPALDMTAQGEGALTYKGLGMTTEDIQLCARTYLGDADPKEPLASPLHAPDLTGLAPAFVLTVEHDALRWEGQQYAKRLVEAGVPTTEYDVDGHVHASLSVPALYKDGIAEIYERMVSFMTGQLATAATGLGSVQERG